MRPTARRSHACSTPHQDDRPGLELRLHLRAGLLLSLELLKHGQQVGQRLARAGRRGHRHRPAGQQLWDGHRLHRRRRDASQQAGGFHELGAQTKLGEPDVRRGAKRAGSSRKTSPQAAPGRHGRCASHGDRRGFAFM
jgi:hypothetical protein